MDKDSDGKLLREIHTQLTATNMMLVAHLETYGTQRVEQREWCKDIEDEVKKNTASINKIWGSSGVIAIGITVLANLVWPKH